MLNDHSLSNFQANLILKKDDQVFGHPFFIKVQLSVDFIGYLQMKY